MIDLVNAGVANVAMGSSGWSVEQALIAELYLQVMGFDLKRVLSLHYAILTEHTSQKTPRKRNRLQLGFLMLVEYLRDNTGIDERKDEVDSGCDDMGNNGEGELGCGGDLAGEDVVDHHAELRNRRDQQILDRLREVGSYIWAAFV